MKVSVVTVCYNSAATIADTLRSVSTQRYPDIEHIVVDGASTDDTLRIVERHGERVARLVSERDSGIFDAMNKGIRLATGDLIGFLQSDDMFAGDSVVADIAAAAAADESDLVYGDLDYVDRTDTTRIIRRWRSGSFSHRRLRFGWSPPHPTLYARARLFGRIGQFDSRLRIAADYDFLLRCLSTAGIRAQYIPKVLVKMRVGGISNRSLRDIMLKSSEDLLALRRNNVGGLLSLACKNLRKLPQFL